MIIFISVWICLFKQIWVKHKKLFVWKIVFNYKKFFFLFWEGIINFFFEHEKSFFWVTIRNSLLNRKSVLVRERKKKTFFRLEFFFFFFFLGGGVNFGYEFLCFSATGCYSRFFRLKKLLFWWVVSITKFSFGWKIGSLELALKIVSFFWGGRKGGPVVSVKLFECARSLQFRLTISFYNIKKASKSDSRKTNEAYFCQTTCSDKYHCVICVCIRSYSGPHFSHVFSHSD